MRKMEPYVYCQMVAGKDAARPGEGKNSWLTGAAAWNYYAISHYILGIRPDYDGLCIDPCIPSEWRKYQVRRRFRGKLYAITVENPEGVNRGVKHMEGDVRIVKGCVVPLDQAVPRVNVRVVLGGESEGE